MKQSMIDLVAASVAARKKAHASKLSAKAAFAAAEEKGKIANVDSDADHKASAALEAAIAAEAGVPVRS